MRRIIIADDINPELLVPQDPNISVPVQPAVPEATPAVSPPLEETEIDKPVPAVQEKEQYKNDLNSLVLRYRKYYYQGTEKSERNKEIVFRKIWNYPYASRTIGAFLVSSATNNSGDSDPEMSAKSLLEGLLDPVFGPKDISNFAGYLSQAVLSFKPKKSNLEWAKEQLTPYIQGVLFPGEAGAAKIPEDIMELQTSDDQKAWEAYRRDKYNNYKISPEIDRIMQATARMENELITIVDSMPIDKIRQAVEFLKSKEIGLPITESSPDGTAERNQIKSRLIPMSRRRQFVAITKLLSEAGVVPWWEDKNSPDWLNFQMVAPSEKGLGTAKVELFRKQLKGEDERKEEGTGFKNIIRKKTINPVDYLTKSIEKDQRILEDFVSKPNAEQKEEARRAFEIFISQPDAREKGKSKARITLNEFFSKLGIIEKEEGKKLLDMLTKKPSANEKEKEEARAAFENLISQPDVDEFEKEKANEMLKRFKYLLPSNKEFKKVIDYITFGYEDNDPKKFISDIFRELPEATSKDPKQEATSKDLKQMNKQIEQKIYSIMQNPEFKKVLMKDRRTISDMQKFDSYLTAFIDDLRKTLIDDSVWEDIEKAIGKVAFVVRRMLRTAAFVLMSRIVKKG